MTNRLVDIVVEEVSLVDRAANNHTFLIVKRSDGMGAEEEEEALEDLNAVSEEQETRSETETGAPAESAPPAPTAMEQVLGALKDLATRFDASIARIVAPAPAPVVPDPAPVTPAPPPPSVTASSAPPEGEVAKALAALTKSVEQLGTVVKGQGLRLAQMEKRTGVPASLPAGERPTRASTSVSWPLDMNSPRGRNDVSKDYSFHDAAEGDAQ